MQGAVKLMREGPQQDKSIVNFSSIAGKVHCGSIRVFTMHDVSASTYIQWKISECKAVM